MEPFEERLISLEKDVSLIKKISWIILGMLITKAGFDITPIVSAFLHP